MKNKMRGAYPEGHLVFEVVVLTTVMGVNIMYLHAITKLVIFNQH